jgi:hypothetical protein
MTNSDLQFCQMKVDFKHDFFCFKLIIKDYEYFFI